MDENGIRIFVAVGIFAYITGTSATPMVQRLIWMHLTHPALIARAFGGFSLFLFCPYKLA
jgi:hypothetical protein